VLHLLVELKVLTQVKNPLAFILMFRKVIMNVKMIIAVAVLGIALIVELIQIQTNYQIVFKHLIPDTIGDEVFFVVIYLII